MNFKGYFNYDVKELTENDLEDIYNLCKDNKEYYEYIRVKPTLENVKEILNEIPPSSSKENKNCIGLYSFNKLIAILDFIEDYPDSTSCFIGLLIINKEYQGKGIGKEIIESLIKISEGNGYKRIGLGVIEDNISAKLFWKNRGFIPTGVVYNHDKYNVIMMEKVL